MRIPITIPIALVSALTVFAPLWEGGTTHAAVMVTRLLILFLMGLFLVTGVQNGRIEVPVLPIRYMVVCFVGLAVLSTLTSPYLHPSRQWLLVLMTYVVFLYLVVSFVQSWEHIYVLAIVIVAVGLGEAGWTIFQRIVWKVPRPAGTFFNPNFLAGYLVVSWTILLSLLLHSHRIPSRFSILLSRLKARREIAMVAALSMIMAAILLTQSRAGILLVFVATLFAVTARYGPRVAVVCGMVVLTIFLVAPTTARERLVLEHNQNPEAYARWKMWGAALQQMTEHPLGNGLGLYQYSYPRYAFPVEGQISRYGKVAQTPHNDYLQMGVEMGPAAVFVFIIGLFLTGREAVSLPWKRLSRWQRGLLIGVCGGGVALLIHAGLDSSLREPALALMLTLCIGLVFSANRLQCSDEATVRVIPVRSRYAWALVSATMLVLVGIEVIRLGVGWIYFDSAARYVAEGQTPLAIEQLREAVAIDPGKALYHQGLGSIHAKIFDASGDEQAFQTARSEFQEAIEINPLDGRLSALMGQLYVSASKTLGSSPASNAQRNTWLQSAREAYERAATLMPFVAAYRYEQARLCWLLGERSEAERRAKEVEVLEPNFLPARALLMRMYLDAGEAKAAAHQLHEIQERQERYRNWTKNNLEQAFLNVDMTSLPKEIPLAG